MKKRHLGRSDIWAGEIGIGCWAIGGLDWNLDLPMGWQGVSVNEAVRGLRRAIEIGANLFDTADVYGHGQSERLLGQAIAAIPRTAVILASKVGYFRGTAPSAYHPLQMRHQLEMTLRNLRTDYLDIYFFHNLYFGPRDEYLADAVAQMQRFKHEGLIRSIGMRGPHTYAPDRLRPAHERQQKGQRFLDLVRLVAPEIIGIRYNALSPEPVDGFDIFRWSEECGLGILMYKPLAQGLLLDKYDPNEPPRFEAGDHRSRKRWFGKEGLHILHRRLALLRERLEISQGDLAHVALQYCLHRSEIAIPVVGFVNVSQVERNLASPTFVLSEQDVKVVGTTLSGIHDELGHYFDVQLG